MQYIVPLRYFDDYITHNYMFEYENRTLILLVNVVYGYIQYLFLVQEHNRFNAFQLLWNMERRSTLLPATQLSVRPYSLPQWKGFIWMEDPRAVLNILHLGILSGLDYLWKTRVENEDTKCKSQIIQSESLLPNTQLLNYLSGILGRKSVLIKELCRTICLDLKGRSNDIIDVLAAYVPDKENEIVFMVTTEKNCQSPRILDRPFVHRCIDAFSAEAAHVIENEIQLKGESRKQLRKIVNKHTDKLLREHKNITLISISSVKSKFFKTRQKKLCPEPCVVLYVHVKGVIPIDEDPFPKTLDGFATDVREGAFSPFVLESSQVHSHIKMGCQIQGPGYNIDEAGNVLGGTLGGFIDHPRFGLCCFTSAHVMLSDTDMQNIWQVGCLHPQCDLACYQPCPPDKFGSVVLAVCKEGNPNSPGVEVVMIKLEDRPLDNHGRFPGTDVLEYRSGEILDHSELIQHMSNSEECMEVIKYGAETGITTGKVHSEETSIRLTNFDLSHRTLKFTLRNQIEVASDHTFAKHGDSGAMVFHFSQNKSLKAIGMLEGGTSYNTYIVTPIYAILESLGLPPPLHMKVFDHIPMETSNLEYLEQRVDNLERTTENIKVDVADIKTELRQQRQTMDEQGQKLDKILSILSAQK